jgi:hypothetical protein
MERFIQYVLFVAIIVLAYFVYGAGTLRRTSGNNRDQHQENFAPLEEEVYQDMHADQFMISPENIPTYALYQPNISGRHLNFFSHAPNTTLLGSRRDPESSRESTTPFYPDQVWTAQISDPYYQPAYKSYFYQEGYFYPMG